jgi:hypothetical protein
MTNRMISPVMVVGSVQRCGVEQIQLRIFGRDAPLKRDATWARYREQIAIPRRLRGVLQRRTVMTSGPRIIRRAMITTAARYDHDPTSFTPCARPGVPEA